MRGRLNEMINDVYRILRRELPVQARDFFPPLRRILATHHPLPDYPMTEAVIKNNRGEIMDGVFRPSWTAGTRSASAGESTDRCA